MNHIAAIIFIFFFSVQQASDPVVIMVKVNLLFVLLFPLIQ